jgi:hypothetical protein
LSIRESLETILARYGEARARDAFGKEHELWEVFRSLRRELEAEPAVERRSSLAVTWSAGQAAWARIPWVAFVDTRQTRTTQQGVYAAYLFRADLSGAYLVLTQGSAGPRRQLGRAVARATLERRAADLRGLCRSLPGRGFRLDGELDLRSDSGLARDHAAAVVAHRLYPAGEVPDDRELEADLEALLGVYDQYASRRRSYSLPRAAPALAREPRPARPRFEPAPAVERLIESIEWQRFVFEPWQVAAYVAALRTKPFVILAGVTGTGKSRLPGLVERATGGEARVVPVRPDWTDSSELLGYSDLQGAFRPGVLLSLAREAVSQPERHWTCVLDEMNLARVEQYFAEVLSRIEDRTLASDGGYSTGPLLHPTLADPAWSALALPSNLALVGTVNMDESAHGFSRKVLDRAFTLELSDVDLGAWEVGPAEPREPAAWPAAAWHPRAVRLGELDGLSETERARVQGAIDALREANRQLGGAQLQVGYRTRDETALFVLHAAEIASSFVTRAGEPVDPLDLALQMKLLPRILGGSAAVRRAVLGLLGWAWSGAPFTDEADALPLLEDWEAEGRPGALPAARFPHTAARLALMWERMLAEGFTSFWA